MYKTQKDLQQRSHHAWPQIPIDPRVSHSSQAQKPKHAPPKDPMVAAFDNTRSYSWSRAHTCRRSLTRWRWYTCLLRMTSWMTSSSTTSVWPGLTWKPDPVRTACQKKNLNKKKKKSFDQIELWLWLKSQNFQKRLVPINFSSTFRFWDPFLHLKLRNCANCPIPKKLTFAQILTKKSKFSRSTCLAQFFA